MNSSWNAKCHTLILIVLIYTTTLFSGFTFAIDLPNSPTETPENISSIVMAKSINEKTGEAINITSEFSATDKDIILIVAPAGCKTGTRIEYVRYLNYKFLDHGSIKLQNTQSDTVSFIWSLQKKDGYHLKGHYRIKTYINGKFEKEISYIVK